MGIATRGTRRRATYAAPHLTLLFASAPAGATAMDHVWELCWNVYRGGYLDLPGKDGGALPFGRGAHL
jgi:hypothetical protein